MNQSDNITILQCDCFTTNLSENVFNNVVNLQKLTDKTTFLCLNDELLFNWVDIDVALGGVLGYETVHSFPVEWFHDKNRLVWSIINSTGHKFNEASFEKKSNILKRCNWIGDVVFIEELITKNDLDDNEILLCLLKLTSHLERSLGNIFAFNKKPVPFLLKDLLASEFLIDLIGRTQAIFLQLLFGSVHGLNLRNIAWHGFFTPGELHQNIIFSSLILIASLYEILQDKALVTPRNYVDLTKHSEFLSHVYSEVNIDEGKFINALINCKHVPKAHWQYWRYSYCIYKNGRTGDFLIFIIPLLENLLRSTFCYANSCPRRMFTAESTSFYIILDDILAPSVPSGDNKIVGVIGEKLLEILLDVFIHPEGPQLRDKLSHNEANLNTIPEILAHHIIGTAISLMLKINNVEVNIDSENDWAILLSEQIPNNYVSIYHPISLLKTTLINVAEKMKMWDKFQFQPELSHSGNTDLKMLHKYFCEDLQYNVSNLSNAFNTIQFEVRHTYPLTLFRPKSELEFVSLLRRLSSKMIELDENVTNNIKTKADLWIRGEMRSRGRENYKRLIQALPIIQLAIFSLLLMVSVTLKKFQSEFISEINEFQRYLKSSLKFIENGVSMSSLSKNRWSEFQESSLNVSMKTIEIYKQFF